MNSDQVREMARPLSVSQLPLRRLALALLLGLGAACAGARPEALGVTHGRFAPCPPSPNCVSSDAADAGHRVDAFAYAGAPDAAWRALRDALGELPRTALVTDEDGYIHAECTSALMRYVDDLELQLRAADGAIAVRSASRVGYSDLGVNRDRVGALREALRARGVLR